MKKTLVLLASMAVMTSSAMASCHKTQIQSYAHPTLFGSEAQIDVCAKTSSIIGGKITKCPCAKTIVSNVPFGLITNIIPNKISNIPSI